MVEDENLKPNVEVLFQRSYLNSVLEFYSLHCLNFCLKFEVRSFSFEAEV